MMDLCYGPNGRWNMNRKKILVTYNFHLGFLPTHIGRTGGENMAVYSDLVRNEYKAYSHGFVGVNSH